MSTVVESYFHVGQNTFYVQEVRDCSDNHCKQLLNCYSATEQKNKMLVQE